VVGSGVSLVAVSATLPNGARLGERTGAECTRPKENLIRLLLETQPWQDLGALLSNCIEVTGIES
jgi:hypothetical protein